MGKLAKVLAALVGLVLVLVGALALLLQTSAVSNRVKDLIVPRVSESLGREVSVKEASLHLLPPRVALRGTTVAGRSGEPPLVDVESFEVGLALGPLVTSLGKDIRVTAITLVRPSLNLVRAKDGTWNYEGLGGEQPKEKAPSPAAPSDRSFVVEHASIQDGSVKLVDHATGDKAAVALSKIDLAAEHVGLGQPLHAKLSAAIAGAEKNFEAELSSPRLPEVAAGPGAKPTYPELSGALAVKGLDLAKLRGFMPPKLTGMMTGGRADARAKLTTKDGKYLVDGEGKLSQLRLRGDPAQGSFELHAQADPVSGAVHAAIEKLAVKGPGVDLGGRVAADVKPMRVRFAIAGPLLDLGQVLALMPPSEKQEPESAGLTPELKKSLEAADVAGTIDIDKVVRGGLVATNFKANAALEKGLFVLKDARADLFGGRVDAGGTQVDLAEAEPKWNLKAKLDSVDMAKGLAALGGGAAPLAGKLTGALALDGAGADWNAIKPALTGNGGITLKDGALTTTDLGDKLLGALSQGLKATGRTGLAGKVGGAEGGKTSLKDLAAEFTVKDGAMALSKPLSFTAPFGAAKLGGKIGLGGELRLDGTATIPKQTLAGIASGLPLPNGLEVPLSLGGTLTAPTVNVNAQQAVAGLVSGAAKQGLEDVKQRALRQGRNSVQDALKGSSVKDALKGFGIGK